MKNQGKKYGLGALAVALLVWFDQWTKQLAQEHLTAGPHVIWDGVFELRYSINKGAAFGILQNQRIFFIISTCLVLAAILYCYHKIPATKKNLPLLAMCVSVTAGALGNFIDRLYLEYVIDFLYFKLINFPIFNVADIYITVSCFVFMFLMFFFYKEEDLEFFGKNDKQESNAE
ncbi:MAG: signal peptidase II [Lachnospiraceae bacterium]|nr:signal peptidase II [Lachnospiraceae bacterium]